MVRRTCAIPLALLLSVVVACSAAPDRRSAPTAVEPARPPEPPPPFDPPAPELRLPSNFALAAVKAWLRVDPAQDRFEGAVELAGEVTVRSARLWLHGRGLTVREAFAQRGEQRVALQVAAVGEDLLALRTDAALDVGAWTVTLRYEGGFEPVATVGAFKQLDNGRPYVATQFESIFARRVFPCLDEPGVKVPWQLTLDVPVDQVAVSNTPIVSETAIDPTHKRVVFAQSKPLPSYLIAFGVGPYDIVDAGATRSGTPVRVFAFKGRAAEAAWAAQTSAQIVDVLEDWFGIPYPYEKLDMLAIPVTSGFGAMENAGLITYAQRLILHDPATITLQQRRAWLSVASHEIAHQWFGDLVTPQWWDDIWLNEGFATWMQPKALAALEGKLDATLIDKRDAELEPLRSREVALAADQLVNARKIRQPIERGGDIFTVFDRITYQKGASVLTMFERHLGRDVMRRAVTAYLNHFRFSNATSKDFLAAVSDAAGLDVAPTFSTFLDQTGAPAVGGELRCAAGAAPVLELRQQRFLVPGAGAPTEPAQWSLPVCVAYDRDGARAESCLTVAAPSVELALSAKSCPRWIMLNVGGGGYYRAAQSAAGYQALRDLAWQSLSAAERLTVFHDATALGLAGQLPIDLALSLVPKMLAERHRIPVRAAVDLADQLKGLLPAAQQAGFDAWIRTTFGPLARSLTWTPRRGEDLDAEEIRTELVPLVALAGDVALRKSAVTLSKSWRKLSATTRAEVLGSAAASSRALFEELLAAVVEERSAEVRSDLLQALASVTSEAQLRQVLALMFEAKLDPRETRQLLFAGRTPAQRDIIATYFRQHLEPLLARLPSAGASGSSATYAFVFTSTCDGGQRTELAPFLRATFGEMPGGSRVVEQALEALDQCIANRSRIVPGVTAWLARGR
jgi:cytosol alanyl aminopeptidase